MRLGNRSISRAHRGIHTTISSSSERGDSFERFCDRQRARIGYQARTNINRYRRRMIELSTDIPKMELRGSCGSDAHEGDNE